MDDPNRTKPGPKAYPIVGVVRDAIVNATGPSLVGLYVYGSLATGDFEPHVSDIDLIAILSDGPPIDSLIPPIPEAEYLDEVRKYLATFRDPFDDDASPGSQAFAILTMCRGLAALRFGDRLSKREAAARTQSEFPRWSDLIDRALLWRDRQWGVDQSDGAATVAEARAFIADMDELLERSSRLEP